MCWSDRPGQHVGPSGLSPDRSTCCSDRPTDLSKGQWPICPCRTVRVDMSDRPGPARTVRPVPRTVRLKGPEVSGFYAPCPTVRLVCRTVRAKPGPSDMVASPTLLSGLGVDLVGRPTHRSNHPGLARTVRHPSGCTKTASFCGTINIPSPTRVRVDHFIYYTQEHQVLPLTLSHTKSQIPERFLRVPTGSSTQ